jgi:tRNA-dihydrouridine synthase B
VQRWLEHLQDHYTAVRRIHRRAQRAQAHRLGGAGLPGGEAFRAAMNTLDDLPTQVERRGRLLRRLADATSACRRPAANDPLA